MKTFLIATLALFTGVTAQAEPLTLVNLTYSNAEFRYYEDGKLVAARQTCGNCATLVKTGISKSRQVEAYADGRLLDRISFDDKANQVILENNGRLYSERMVLSKSAADDYPSRFRKLTQSDVPDNMLSAADAVEEGDTEALRGNMLERRL